MNDESQGKRECEPTPTEAADAAIMRALVGWPEADRRRLAALVSMGPPSQLHAGAPDVPGDSAIGPGGVVETWRTGKADRIRADVLTAWRGVGEIAGVPLPPPGRV